MIWRGETVTTGHGYASRPGPDPLAEQPPPAVAALAQSRQFGPCIANRKLMNPLMVGGVSVVVALACLGLLILMSSVFSDVEGALSPLIRGAALFFCFGFVGALTYGIATLVRGAQSFHVYAGGFVHRRNSKVRAYAWPEVAELRPVVGKRGDAAGKTLSYQLVPRGGAPIGIPLAIENGRDGFMDELMAALRHHGVRVA
jgi:hypothetical protein